MDVGGFLSQVQPVDLLLVLYFMGFFVLGFAQGTIRRVIGIASIAFSFLVAANLAAPLGSFLGANWTQFPKGYSYMLGFLMVFVTLAVVFAIIAQGWYKPQPLFQKARFVDEVLGGVLGVVQAGLILGCVLVILGSYFLDYRNPVDPQEISFLRDLWDALSASAIGTFFIDTLIPLFFAVFGFLVPDDIKVWFPGPTS